MFFRLISFILNLYSLNDFRELLRGSMNRHCCEKFSLNGISQSLVRRLPNCSAVAEVFLHNFSLVNKNDGIVDVRSYCFLEICYLVVIFASFCFVPLSLKYEDIFPYNVINSLHIWKN